MVIFVELVLFNKLIFLETFPEVLWITSLMFVACHKVYLMGIGELLIRHVWQSLKSWCHEKNIGSHHQTELMSGRLSVKKFYHICIYEMAKGDARQNFINRSGSLQSENAALVGLVLGVGLARSSFNNCMT